MAGESDTTEIIASRNDFNIQFKLFGIIIVAVLLSFVAIVIAIVSISSNNNTSVYLNGVNTDNSQITDNNQGIYVGGSDDRVYLFHVGHFGANTQYWDDRNQEVRGFHIDIVNAVCQIANKNCELVNDVFNNCWDSQVGQIPRGGKGLMSGWYDGCVGWVQKYDRRATFLFTNPFTKNLEASVIVRKGGTLPNYPDFTNVKIGFLDGWYSDEHCMARFDQFTGFKPADSNQVVHYEDQDLLLAALVAGDIDCIFAGNLPKLFQSQDVYEIYPLGTVDRCIFGGSSIMLRKDRPQIVSWWNAAFDKLVTSRQYLDICDDIKTTHGDIPGGDPSEICFNYV